MNYLKNKRLTFQARIDSQSNVHIIQTNQNSAGVKMWGDDCICNHCSAKCILRVDGRLLHELLVLLKHVWHKYLSNLESQDPLTHMLFISLF